jgi:DNA-binding transcriptional MocR family regulator
VHAHVFGVGGPDTAWNRGQPKMLCPVPGYDRHFSLTEHLGIEMVPVELTEDGPDMDRVEELVGNDHDVVGMWCVPKYANPTGITYATEVVRRLARLGQVASDHFRIMWDNAYAVHDLTDQPDYLESIFTEAEVNGTQDSVVQFASTSKITLAGSGVAFLGTSLGNLAAFRDHLQYFTIGPDKVNHLRHVRKLGGSRAIGDHMAAQAELIRPKFAIVQEVLADGLGDDGRYGHWSTPSGGYFVSFWSRPGLAGEIVDLAAQAGVKLTPAGAAFPYGDDPDDSHIRLAPTYPAQDDVRRAMEVFVTCVKLATARADTTS